MAHWMNLPPEIRCMILKLVVEDYTFDSDQPYCRAGYASVCKEWQPVFEKRNFRRIVVDQERIFSLKQIITSQRQNYLEHMFLRVRLSEYDCTVCQSKADDETIQK